MGDEESPGDPLRVTRAALVEAAARSDVVLGFGGETIPMPGT